MPSPRRWITVITAVALCLGLGLPLPDARADDPTASTTTLMSSANPSTSGTPVTFTADVRMHIPPEVTPVNWAYGSVQFTLDGTALGPPVLLNMGRATKTTTPSAGWHQVVATYIPEGSAQPSSASLVQIVETSDAAATTTSLTSTSNPSLGGPVSLSANVTSGAGTPSGAVQFWTPAVGNIGGPVALNVSGVATTSFSPGARGTYNITARYYPDPGFRASTGTLSQVVKGVPTSITATPVIVVSNLQTPLRFQAQLRDARTGAPMPGRMVNFSGTGLAAANPLCSAPTDAMGIATCPVDVLNVGPLLASGRYLAHYGGSIIEDGSVTTAELLQL